jgi:hypothetical protein
MNKIYNDTEFTTATLKALDWGKANEYTADGKTATVYVAKWCRKVFTKTVWDDGITIYNA